MKTAVSIPDPLFARADALARQLEVSRSELYARALLRLVEDHDEVAVRAALDAVSGRESSDLPAGAAASQAAILAQWK